MPNPKTLALAALMLLVAPAFAQDLPLTQQLTRTGLHPLDLARDIKNPILESAIHTPLPEQYIWTASDTPKDAKLVYTFPGVMEQTEPHYFRATFNVTKTPASATLYVAGPRSIRVFLNGKLAEQVESDLTSPLNMHVFSTNVARYLQLGKNTIAIQAVRGRGVTGFANSALVRQQTFGQVMVAKILTAPQGIADAPALLLTDKSWRGATSAPPNWQLPTFDDASWRPVQSIGGIESSIELFQWNADAGLYNWPGYDGISPFLAHLSVPPSGILAHYAGRGSFTNLESLTTPTASFTVKLPATTLTAAESPSLFLDFGRELTGRLEIVSDSDTPATLTVQMGESESEAMKAPFLGVNQLTIPPHGIGHGSKTAFRYARITFTGGGPELRFKAIRVDHIYYPVTYAGSFSSSDPLLNQIWDTGAYTTHLCMQDGVWDASKRDRGRWMGDTDVSGRVIEDVFDDHTLMEDTLDRLMGPRPEPGAGEAQREPADIDQHVNGIPGYSSFWFTGVADYYRHTGSLAFLQREHQRLLQLLTVVDKEFDERNVYANKSNVWLYVDWSPQLNGDTPETRRATTLEFLRAYREAAFLLHELGDTTNATKYEARAKAIAAGSQKYLLDPATQTFGPRWQTNAAAVISGASTPTQNQAIWNEVFSQVGKHSTNGLIISPYYNDYVLRAMAQLNHRSEALAWIRTYWGGMINEGATSFWEAYDPDWYKEDFHASLQSDNRSGYFVSLAHGWSAGPTAWLSEEVLGIQPTGPGFATVDIRPDLIDLKWAKGAVPTPHGLITESITPTSIDLDIPPQVTAKVLVPAPAGAKVSINGKPTPTTPTEDTTRQLITITQPGHYTITTN